jgi:hypothetical protein
MKIVKDLKIGDPIWIITRKNGSPHPPYEILKGTVKGLKTKKDDKEGLILVIFSVEKFKEQCGVIIEKDQQDGFNRFSVEDIEWDTIFYACIDEEKTREVSTENIYQTCIQIIKRREKPTE